MKDRKLHWWGGFVLGVLSRPLPRSKREQTAAALDRWAFAREERQNEAGENPNHPMSEHQQDEARAWVEGFRRAAGIA